MNLYTIIACNDWCAYYGQSMTREYHVYTTKLLLRCNSKYKHTNNTVSRYIYTGRYQTKNVPTIIEIKNIDKTIKVYQSDEARKLISISQTATRGRRSYGPVGPDL